MWKVSVYIGSDTSSALGSGVREKNNNNKKKIADCQSSFSPHKNQGGAWIIAAW